MKTARYFVTDINASHYLFQWMPDWFGVVDEELGGIIAYFSRREYAEAFTASLTPAQAGE